MSTTAGKNNDKTDSVNRSAVKTRLSRKIQNEAERIAREHVATTARYENRPTRQLQELHAPDRLPSTMTIP